MLHQDIIEKFERANFSSTFRNRALKFLRILTKKSKQNNDDHDSYDWVYLSSNYLLKTFGGQYTKIIDKLLEFKIIERNNHYSVTNNKCKQYRLIQPNNRVYKDIDSIGYKGDNRDNKSTLFTFLQLPDYQELIYTEKLSPETRELTKNFRQAVDILKIINYKISSKVFKRVVSLNIKNFKVNEQITEQALCKGDPLNKYNWRSTKSLIEKATKQGKLLIQDKKKYFIMTEQEFLEKKKLDMLESHISILRKIERGEYFASRNSTNNRLDTNFTSMPSYMLEEIMSQNNLIEIDLCNSQLAILTLVCDLDTDDFRRFKALSLGCGIYTYIQQELGLETREQAKDVCFSILFSHHHSKNKYVSQFKDLFPSVSKWITDYKKQNGSNKFSIMLQKKEAEIFIDNIYQNLIDAGLLVFSKHDSVIVRRDDKDTAVKIIQNYFDEIGFDVIINV